MHRKLKSTTEKRKKKHKIQTAETAALNR